VIFSTKNILSIMLALILLVVSTGCDVFSPPPTPTATATNTPLPTNTPVPTETPLPPTATFTETPVPLPTASPIPFNPPPPVPTATIPPKEQIKIFYINPDDKGPYGCGESYAWVPIGQKYSDDTVADIKLALYRLLTYYQPNWGNLLHGGYASHLAVGDVSIDAGRTAHVNLTGDYVPTDDPCDAARFRDQIKLTIKQFPLVLGMAITINGHPIGDVIVRKK
jgi:hypothetical protein